MTTIVVIAKECVAGRVKTRLAPPFSLVEAAELAEASLRDTIERADRLPVTRRVLAWDGANPPEEPGWEILPQVEGTLDVRLGAIFDACSGPTVLIGMDSPQFDPLDLVHLFSPWPVGIDAAIGPSTDGGFWALGMAHPCGDPIRGVPMSADDTCAVQRRRLEAAGLRVHTLPTLTDVDTARDAERVAALAPDGRFARTLGALRVAGSGADREGVS